MDLGLAGAVFCHYLKRFFAMSCAEFCIGVSSGDGFFVKNFCFSLSDHADFFLRCWVVGIDLAKGR